MTILKATAVALTVIMCLGGCASPPQLPPDEHWSKGTEAYHARDYKNAVYHFTAILENHAARKDLAPATLYFLGETYLKMGKDKKAEEVHKTLIRKHPLSSYARLVYGRD